MKVYLLDRPKRSMPEDRVELEVVPRWRQALQQLRLALVHRLVKQVLRGQQVPN